jgi:hypothetical protein
MSIGRIESAITRDEMRVVVGWGDGRRAEINLAGIAAAHPALSPLADPDIFHRIRVSDDGWSLEWPNCGIDFGSAQLRSWADEQAGEAMRADFRA